MSDLKQLFILIDVISSEYGWTFSEIVSLPFDTLFNFYKAILERKKSEYKILAKLIAVGVNCGFSGKMDGVNNLLNDNEPLDEESKLNELRKLCSTLGMKTEDFEKQLKEGKVVI